MARYVTGIDRRSKCLNPDAIGNDLGLSRGEMAPVEGIEPSSLGSKPRIITIIRNRLWQRREESNLRFAGSEPAGLPLTYTAIGRLERNRTADSGFAVLHIATLSPVVGRPSGTRTLFICLKDRKPNP